MLEVKEVTKSFGPGPALTAVSGVTITVAGRRVRRLSSAAAGAERAPS